MNGQNSHVRRGLIEWYDKNKTTLITIPLKDSDLDPCEKNDLYFYSARPEWVVLQISWC